MDIRDSFWPIKLFLDSALKHLEKPLSVVVDWIDKVDSIIDKLLFDHVIKEGFCAEGRRWVDLKQPTFQVLVKDDIEAIEIETAWVVRDIVLSSD